MGKGKTMEELYPDGANIFAEAEDAARKIKANFRTLRRCSKRFAMPAISARWNARKPRPRPMRWQPGSKPTYGRCTAGIRSGHRNWGIDLPALAMAAGPLMHWHQAALSVGAGRHGRGRLECPEAVFWIVLRRYRSWHPGVARRRTLPTGGLWRSHQSGDRLLFMPPPEQRWEMRLWNVFHLMIVIDVLSITGATDRTPVRRRARIGELAGAVHHLHDRLAGKATRHGGIPDSGTVVASLVLSVVIYMVAAFETSVLALPVTTMPIPEIAAGLIAKAGGAIAGAILALVHPPKTRAEFWRRGRGSLIMGVVFGAGALSNG